MLSAAHRSRSRVSSSHSVAGQRLQARFHGAQSVGCTDASRPPRRHRADRRSRRGPAGSTRNIPDAWKVVYIFGGVSMYAALRAMEEALGRDDLSLVTANAIFLAPVPPGPITIDVDVLARRPPGVAGRGRSARSRRRQSRAACARRVRRRARHRARAPRGPLPRGARSRPTSQVPARSSEPVRPHQLPRPDRLATGQPARRSRQGPLPLVGAPARERTRTC